MAKDFKVVGQLVIDDKGQLGILGKKARKAGKDVESVGTSARSADRRLKGAAQASSGASKNFSKMAQGIQGGLVPAYATLAASLFAITAVFRGLEEAANIKNQIAGMEQFGAITGKNMMAITASIREATNGILDFRTAAQSAAITSAAGFNADQVEELAEGAKLASVALGRDLTDSFNRLVRGVTKAEPELLDELGIILRLDVATRKFAQANGLVADRLTIAQRRTAVFNEVSEQLANNFGEFRENADKLTNPFARLQTAFNDIIVAASSLITPLEFFAEFLSRNTGAAALLFGGFAISILKSAFPALNDITKAVEDFGDRAQKSADIAVQSFKENTASFKQNATEIVRLDKIKSSAIKKELAKRKLDEARFNDMSPVNQRRSLKLMITNLEKKAAQGKAINEKELAHLKSIHARMLQSHQTLVGSVISLTKTAGAATAVAIAAPAAAAQTGIALLAKNVLTVLTPAFRVLGAAINGAFFLFTAGFIVKLIYDSIFATEEYKKEQDKLNAEFDKSGQLLEHAAMAAQFSLKKGLDDSKITAQELNKELLKTAALFAGLLTNEQIRAKAEELGLDPGRPVGDIRQTTAARTINNLLVSRIVASRQATDADTFRTSIEDLFNNIIKAKADKGFMVTRGTEQKLAEVLEALDTGNMEAFSEILTTNFASVTGNLSLNTVLDIVAGFNQINESAIASGTAVMDLGSAFENFDDIAGRFKKKFRATEEQTLGKAFAGVLDQVAGIVTPAVLDEEGNVITKAVFGERGTIGKNLTKAQIVAIIDQEIGRKLKEEEVDPFLQALLKGQEAIAKAPGLQATLGDEKTELSRLKARKDALSKELAITQQLVVFDAERDVIANKIAILESNRVNITDPTELKNLETLIGKEQDRLDVIKNQRAEFERANSMMGKLQDTLSMGIEKMFFNIATGASNAADAFRSMTKLILVEIAKIAAASAAADIIKFMGFGFAQGGIMPVKGLAGGGYASSSRMRFGTGGIATRPTYMVGEGKHNEAVVPLPDGRTIPVTMQGAGAGNTNVVINVDGASTASGGGMNAEQGRALGEMVQAATMEIIQREKRPGGVLSR